MTRLMRQVDLAEHHLCEVSDTVEIAGVGVCIGEGYVERETGRDQS